MAVGAVLGFAVTALALLVMGRSWRGWHPSAFLAIVAGLIGVLGILGLPVRRKPAHLDRLGDAGRLPAALGLSVLAAGLVAADPEHGLMRLLSAIPVSPASSPPSGADHRAGPARRRLAGDRPGAGGHLDEPVGWPRWSASTSSCSGGVGIWIAGGVAGLGMPGGASTTARVGDTSEDLIAATDVEGA